MPPLQLDSYAALKSTLADFLNRVDLTDAIPAFIVLCESRLRRSVRTKHVALLTASLAEGDGSATLPTHLVDVQSVSLTSPTTEQGPLQIVSYGELLRHRQQHSEPGVPARCALVGETLHFSPLADGVYQIGIEVEGPFVPLSDAATSNWLLADYPDLYLYGSLVASAPYLKDDERLALWESLYQNALGELDRATDRAEWPSTPILPLPQTFAL